jgi:hypothetical protein
MPIPLLQYLLESYDRISSNRGIDRRAAMSAPLVVSSLPLGENDPMVTLDCSGADFISQAEKKGG